MIFDNLTLLKNKDEARQIAIKWQNWASKRNLSYGELAEWQGYFISLARKFHLVREFKENGIL